MTKKTLLSEMKEREWDMGNGQCRDCCGLDPSKWWWKGKNVGHRKGCLNAKTIEALGGKVKWVLVVLAFASSSFASNLPPASVARLADAIYVAEGGARARVPYGVLSVKVRGEAEARRVCEASVRNNWRRWEAAGRPGKFIQFMADRWVPKKSDPVGNRNWVKNMEKLTSKII